MKVESKNSPAAENPKDVKSNKPGNQVDSRDPRVMEAARLFESQFLRQMVGEMRKTVPESELLAPNMAEKYFREQMDNEHADTWVQQGGIGLADMIYDQLQDRMPQNLSREDRVRQQKFYPLEKNHAQMNPLPPTGKVSTMAAKPGDSFVDIISKEQGQNFLAKKVDGGFNLKSKGPLTQNVSLRSPLPGLVLQAQILEDGRQAVVVRHPGQGLVSQIVHSGRNYVSAGDQVIAGQALGFLPADQDAGTNPASGKRVAEVFFGLRPERKAE